MSQRIQFKTIFNFIFFPENYMGNWKSKINMNDVEKEKLFDSQKNVFIGQLET